jgi:hypothetical protein
MNMGVDFYKNLFSLNDDFFFMFDAPNLFPQIEASLVHRLHGVASLEEICASPSAWVIISLQVLMVFMLSSLNPNGSTCTL